MMENIKERFEAKFIKGNGCWEWMAGRVRGGYGKFGIGRLYQYAHRVAYRLYVGEIPEGLCVLHRCDNKGCVRPDHLFLGTDADNVYDCMSKGRRADQSGGNNGRAKLTEEQVLMIRARRSEGARGVDLAKEFGVAQRTISAIVCGVRWEKL